MAVKFTSALSQWMQIAGPRPELAGLSAYTFTCWVRWGAMPPSRQMVYSFSTGTSTSTNRSGLCRDYWGGTPITTHVQRGPDGSAEARVFWSDQSFMHGQSMFLAGGVTSPPPGFGSRIWVLQKFFGGLALGNGGTGGTGPVAATPSLAAAIGSQSDGLGQHIDAEIEDLRLYTQEIPTAEMQRIIFRYGADRRAFMHPNLVLWWGLAGVGSPGVELDKISGVAATAMNGPTYANMGLHRRRRNRGG